MVKRNPVSVPQNIWSDAQAVDDIDLTLEQNYNNAIEAGLIKDHVGTGVLLESLNQNILFDSSVAVGYLDGVAVYAQNQPTDNNYGNQINITLTGSKAAGKKNVKLAVIGLDFNSVLQYETFVFKTNETQTSKKHFTKILLILLNDFVGDPLYSMNLGGLLKITEAKPMTLSREPIMVAQDIQPNLFFRDFFVTTALTLNNLLVSALPDYDVNTLNIYTGILENKVLAMNDVTTQVGQKFLATTNNIQKISVLLSVQNLISPLDLTWNGDLVISIFGLQSDVNCITDIAPNLPIDFSPTNIPLAQISINYASLLAQGITLDSVPQPIEFVFSNSPIATGSSIVAGNYYAFTAKRSGSANKSDLLITCGADRISNSRLTIFNGNIWSDLTDQDLWFKIYTDSAKVTDGQAYESGTGIYIPKTITDQTTNVISDYSLTNISFTSNNVYSAVVAASVKETDPVPDQRTGNPVLSRKQFVPTIELLNELNTSTLESTTEPFILGTISDKNIKFYDSLNSTILSKLYSASIVGDEVIVKIVDDATDVSRYDTSVNELISFLENGAFIDAKFTPNSNNPGVFYKIAGATVCTGLLGDVNGDGVIDQSDLDLLNSFVTYNLNSGLPLSSTITIGAGPVVSYVNGYNTYRQPFSSGTFVSCRLVNVAHPYITTNVLATFTDGILTADPNDHRKATLTSGSTNFALYSNLLDHKIVINIASPVGNYGGFDIVAYDATSNVLTLRKIYLTSETIMQMFRADIDQDFAVTAYDAHLLSSYVDRLFIGAPPISPPYPLPSTNAYSKIGLPMQIIKFKLEAFMDRTDDYWTLASPRPSNVHSSPDIFATDGYYASHDFLNHPSILTFNKTLAWEDYLIVVNSNPKSVSSTFESLFGYVEKHCDLPGATCEVYGSKPAFDPGKVDYYFPNDIIIGSNGNIKSEDGYFHKIDFEVGTVVVEVPSDMDGYEKKINLMDSFVSNYGNGLTRLGFPAMRFADCSFATSESLINNQIRFSVSLQAYSPSLDGYADGYYGIIVDERIGVNIDYTTGLLTLNFSNLYKDSILYTRTTKLQVNVFLKKSGFNNRPLFIDGTKIKNMFVI